jgi:CorA-like Mg2+ transporter protein
MESTDQNLQAEDSARQGRIILLFTIVTIIFLPMGFLASWFGMNIKDPDTGNLPLYQIAAIIFPISIAIALFALVFAFSERLRNFVIRGVKSVLDFVLRTLNTLVGRKRRQQGREERQQQDFALMAYRPENGGMV